MDWFKFSHRMLMSMLFLYIVMQATTVYAFSPPPPEPPSPSPVLPQFDPTPAAPRLSVDQSQDEINLSWQATEHAEYYSVYAYKYGRWRHIEDIRNTATTYDYKRRGWDTSQLQLKILACKAKPGWAAFWETDRCSDYSNTVGPITVKVQTSFTLSAYLPSNSRYSSATLRLTDTTTRESRDFNWTIYWSDDNEATSSRKIHVNPGTYNVELVSAFGRYVARASDVTLDPGEQTIPLELKPVLKEGYETIGIDRVSELSELIFENRSQAFEDSTQARMGIKIDDGRESIITFPEVGTDDVYIDKRVVDERIQLRFYDGVLLKGLSDPEKENPNITAGQPFTMDLKELVEPRVQISLSDNTFNISILGVVGEEVRGDPNNLGVVMSLRGNNNQFEDVVLSGLIYNADSDTYEVQHTYRGNLQADNAILSLSFIHDLGRLYYESLGYCTADNFVLDSSSSNSESCQLTLRRPSIARRGGSRSVLGINVFGVDYQPVRGAAIYAKRQDEQDSNSDNQDDLGEFLGVTASGFFGSPGYLKAKLASGSYKLTATYAPSDATAEETIQLGSLSVENQDLRFTRSLN